MKINVTGRGRVPGINALAPVYNREADIPLIKRILAYRVFRVFDCESGLQITTKNVCEFAKVELEEKEIANRLNINAPKMEKVVIKPIPKENVPVVETKTIIPEPVVYDTTPEPTTTEATPVEESVHDDEVIVDQSVTNETSTDDDIVVAVSDEVVVDSTTAEDDTTTVESESSTKEDTINNIRRNRRNRKKHNNNNQ